LDRARIVGRQENHRGCASRKFEAAEWPAVNAGKVAITQNPLSINWAQWMAFFRYLIPQMHWMFIARENTRAVFVQEKLDESWKQLDAELAIT
jgi:hypothetical protein